MTENRWGISTFSGKRWNQEYQSNCILCNNFSFLIIGKNPNQGPSLEPWYKIFSLVFYTVIPKKKQSVQEPLQFFQGILYSLLLFSLLAPFVGFYKTAN
jgi:hypothetical protein